MKRNWPAGVSALVCSSRLETQSAQVEPPEKRVRAATTSPTWMGRPNSSSVSVRAKIVEPFVVS